MAPDVTSVRTAPDVTSVWTPVRVKLVSWNPTGVWTTLTRAPSTRARRNPMEQPIVAVHARLDLAARRFEVRLISDVPRIGTVVAQSNNPTIQAAMEAVLAGLVTAVKDH